MVERDTKIIPTILTLAKIHETAVSFIRPDGSTGVMLKTEWEALPRWQVP